VAQVQKEAWHGWGMCQEFGDSNWRQGLAVIGLEPIQMV